MGDAPTTAEARPDGLRPARIGVGRAELLAVALTIGLGWHGWHASVGARDERRLALLDARADHYLALAERELDDAGDALERSVALAPGRSGRPDAIRTSASDPEGLQRPPGHRPPDGAHARASIAKARDSGRAVLHADADAVTPAGVARAWLYAPRYAIDSPWGERERRSEFVAPVVAPFDPAPLLTRALRAVPGLAVTVRLGDATLFRGTSPEAGEIRAATPPEGAPRRTLERDVLGRTVEFEIASAALAPDAVATHRWPTYTALSTLALLLAALYRSARFGRERAGLARLASERERRIAALEDEAARLAAFARVVSHDLKTPLRKMQGLTTALAEELECADVGPETSEAMDECLTRLAGQATSMAALVDGIGDRSRADARRERIETIDTRERIAAIADTIGVPGSRLRLSGEFPVVRTWPTRFEQVVANLVGNAWKYHHRPDEALIEVRVRGFGDYWMFSVHDDGPGIDPVHHRRIFEAFESVHVPGVESTGIGLSIVRSVIDGVGGRVSVDSSPGHGATFVFTWPKDVDAVPGDARGLPASG